MDDSSSLHPAIRGLKTVCRCNNIKYRTIERVIKEGACTIAEVAKCTGATTGYCGGTCTPDILAMIAEHGVAAPPPVAQSKTNASNNPDAWWMRKK